MNLSLFQRVESANIHSEPFPHLIIENALPDELHTELRKTFPSRQTLGVTLGQNERWSTSAQVLREIEGITPLWRQFVEYHASKEFLDEVIRAFGELIVKLYPTTFKSVEDLRKRPVVVRNTNVPMLGALSLDAQVSGNSPATHAGAPRGIHFDATNALWAGLFYLRSEDDDSLGGDLELWRWPESYGFRRKSSIYREGMNPQRVLPLKVVPYQSNTLVFLINSIDSLHSVTERMPTPHTRQFLNLVCDLEQPLFRPNPLPQTRIKNLVTRKLGLS